MSNRKLVLGSFLACGTLAALALAHHIPVGLSFLEGPEIMSTITVFKSTSTGIPPYVVSNDEVEHEIAVPVGANFQISDGIGNSDFVTIPNVFPDPSKAHLDDVVEELNEQLTVATLREENGHLVFEGKSGGPSAMLQLTEGVGGALASLQFSNGTVNGKSNIPLVLSIPDPQLNLSGHPYFLLASSTLGTTVIGNKHLDIVLDATTDKFLRATKANVLPGFFGVLDATSDASTTLLPSLLPNQVGAETYFQYVVLTPDFTSIAYVSNVFTTIIG